jgi:hypothetical protein
VINSKVSSRKRAMSNSSNNGNSNGNGNEHAKRGAACELCGEWIPVPVPRHGQIICTDCESDRTQEEKDQGKSGLSDIAMAHDRNYHGSIRDGDA